MGCCGSALTNDRDKPNGPAAPPQVLAATSFERKSYGLYAEAITPRLLAPPSEKKFSFDSGRNERSLSLHKIGSLSSQRPQGAAASDEDARAIVQLLTSVKAPLVLFGGSADCELESEILMGLSTRNVDPFVLDMGKASRLSDQSLWRELQAILADGDGTTVPMLTCRGERISGSSNHELLTSLDGYLRSPVKRVLRVGELEVYDTSVDAWVAGQLELRVPNASGGTDWLFAASAGKFGGKVLARFNGVSAVRPSGDDFDYDPLRFEVECPGGDLIKFRAADEQDALAWIESLQQVSDASIGDPTAGRAHGGSADPGPNSAQVVLIERWQEEIGQATATEWLTELSGLLNCCPVASARLTYNGDGFLDVLDELDEGHVLFRAAGNDSTSSPANSGGGDAGAADVMTAAAITSS